MYCIKCGNKLSEKDKFCTKCGNQVTSNIDPNLVKQINEKEKNNQNLILGISFLVISLIILIFTILFDLIFSLLLSFLAIILTLGIVLVFDPNLLTKVYDFNTPVIILFKIIIFLTSLFFLVLSIKYFIKYFKNKE